MGTKTADFKIDNYGKESVFSSFLPGISGMKGIPIWCFYVNRGQGVVSFGVENKDHAIMEFYPAHQAYQNVKRTGFRTFLKINGNYYEPFQQEENSSSMTISMNGLALEEMNLAHNIQTLVSYYTLPGEKVGALVRKLTIKNTGSENMDLEVLDGMPACIPYGVDQLSIKTMGQTIKAWMQVEDVEDQLPYFRVRVSTEDAASVTQVQGGNFSFACLADGTRLRPIVDPEVVFGYDTTLTQSVGLIQNPVEKLLDCKQVAQNQFPCSFYGTSKSLKPKEELVIYQVIGQVGSKEILKQFMEGKKNTKYFEEKREEANQLTEAICTGIETSTASKEFDAYCKYTYMDNVLRGGYPIQLGKDKVFYIYSRKHGDLERDYNYYATSAEYYSQGNGNFRDVNQNRRCDTFFFPFVGTENIKTFYDLIQLDGYNPLVIEKVNYAIRSEKAESILSSLEEEKQQKLLAFLSKPFTPGTLSMELEDLEPEKTELTNELFLQLTENAERQVNAAFGEGYWSDHWTYNQDLIEEYLTLFPEKEKDILLNQDYTYFLSQKNVNRRAKRYAKAAGGIRQYHALDEKSAKAGMEKLVRAEYGKGEVINSSLLEKLILLCSIKFATLDAYGMGVEMEGGKPGWYDALNGLPGIFGSSMAETYELKRTLEYTIGAIKKYVTEVELLSEVAQLIQGITECVRSEKESLLKEMEVIGFWNKVNDVKEAYREQIYSGVSGERTSLSKEILLAAMEEWNLVLSRGIEKACSFENGICPTYFSFEVTEYEEDSEGIHPKHFKAIKMPLFLEGAVRYLKLGLEKKAKDDLYQNIKRSDLFDDKLNMYKVNASLQDASFEIGRAKAFTPGWLENESIWLHMEYKYLLELLKSGLYEEFFEDFHHCAVPFLDPKVYGRSIYENSSFIASSKNPNESYHGKGFVARLSGSTIEFIQIWKLMMFGKSPFSIIEDELTLKFEPALPDYLIHDKDRIEARFLTSTKVIYNVKDVQTLIPEQYKIKSIECEDKNKSLYTISGDTIKGELAAKIRKGDMTRIEIDFE